MPGHDVGEQTLRRIADYERISGILWLILGIVQVLMIVTIIVGIWNIYAATTRMKLQPLILARDSRVPAAYEGVGQLIVIGVLNLLLGGIIGVVFVVFDFIIRDMVLMKLNAVGLRGAHALMPAELSGGMARRVALARAIALDPGLTMYDEPFAGLDPISLNVIAQLIRRLNDALGATSIVVTYDVSETLKVVDHAYFIHDGKVVAAGTPDELLNSSNPSVHQFIHAEPDGPVAFHYPREPYRGDLELGR